MSMSEIDIPGGGSAGSRDESLRKFLERLLEYGGVCASILYASLIALNIGAEFVAFSLLFVSTIMLGIWAWLGGHKGILFLQVFYIFVSIVGMIRWS